MRQNAARAFIIAAVAADGEFVEQVGLLLHALQIAQMGAAADKHIGMVAGVAGNQWLARPAFAVELAGEKIGAQLFRYPFLIDVHRLNLSVFRHGGVEHRCINANSLLFGGKLPDQIEGVASCRRRCGSS